MAEEQVGEEPPGLPLHHRHPGGVHRRGQRHQPDPLQHPVRGDRQDQPHRRVRPRRSGRRTAGRCRTRRARTGRPPTGGPAPPRCGPARPPAAAPTPTARPSADSTSRPPDRPAARRTAPCAGRTPGSACPAGPARRTAGRSPAASRPISGHGSAQPNAASRSRLAGQQPAERDPGGIFVRAVARTVRKCSRATSRHERGAQLVHAPAPAGRTAAAATSQPGPARRPGRTPSHARTAQPSVAAGEGQAPPAGPVGVATPADDRGPDQRDGDRQLQPGQRQNRFIRLLLRAAARRCGFDLVGLPGRRGRPGGRSHRRSRASNHRNSRTNGPAT